MEERVYISLGSNFPDAACYLARARDALARMPGARLAAASRIYLTEPQNYADQPWFHNQVVCLLMTDWTPVACMRHLLGIEQKLGRVRCGPRFGPRAIDLDMLLFGDAVSDSAECVLPHPRLLERAFALVPLAELDAKIIINGKTAAAWLAKLDWRMEGLKIYQRSAEDGQAMVRRVQDGDGKCGN